MDINTGTPKMVSIDAVITRADGTVEDLGTISYWHKNPLKRAVHKIRNRKGHKHA